MSNQKLTLAEMRERLRESASAKGFWRSLEELMDLPEFLEALRKEFPSHLAAGTYSSSRRNFLKAMGMSLVMAGVSGCGAQPPTERIVPYVKEPEQLVLGKPLFYATAIERGGFATGVLVENHEGRPTKVEGNPQHPASVGGTNALIQGEIFTLYDPDRAQVVTNRGQINTWEGFLNVLRPKLNELRNKQGAGLYVLTETITSPTLGAQLQALQAAFPQVHLHQYEAVSLDQVRAGTHLAFGRSVNPLYHFDKAERVLALDADFLFSHPGSLRFAREFIRQRRLWDAEPQNAQMNRLYAVESTPTITGAKADHRLTLRAGQVEAFAQALAQALGVKFTGGNSAALPEAQQTWLQALVRDLQQHRGASLVIAGEHQSPAVHALAQAMNVALGNVGTTVTYTELVEVNPTIQLDSLHLLIDDMIAGKVDTLLIIDANPVRSAPADFGFAEHLPKVKFPIHSSLYADETSALCQWHIPAAHAFEAWSDTRAYDGTITIMQPLIAPLFNSKSRHEVLAALLGEQPERSGYAIVRDFWSQYYQKLPNRAQATEEAFWQTSLHDGLVAGTALPTIQVALAANLTLPAASANATTDAAAQSLEINFRPDSSLWDGRYASNAWLQELPRHLTLLTLDNAALLSPATAARLGLNNEDLVELRFQKRTLSTPIWIVPGHPDDAVTVHLGYGRIQAAEAGTDRGGGFNTYAIRTSLAPWFGDGLEVVKANGSYTLASTQSQNALEGRDIARFGTLAQFQAKPDFVQNEFDHQTGVGSSEISAPSLYPEYKYDGNAWGMTIDMTSCIGCNACTIACNAENNIPVVGKEGVERGRVMHWLKVDRYYVGEPETPDTYFQPRPCMHCEKAPCEPVCPVEATAHDSEGLNQMVYNRCVGTRYCQNNCPYKVRRFNFFDYTENDSPLLAMWHNPDVTVRGRGVMEKCTYCIQRINQARYEAEKADNRPIRDGEVLTACQEACPTRAIVFGNINDSQSLVATLKKLPINYGMLAELGTQPRTTYLAEMRNPNPELQNV
ncbi:MAG: TAT-variant-translocated molybdopterin oxidoreductase [Chloroflexi bacterium]|nr:TAT-variant-translocated molybdopterin oxidoreductase [Chloroflexota bacterium]